MMSSSSPRVAPLAMGESARRSAVPRRASASEFLLSARGFEIEREPNKQVPAMATVVSGSSSNSPRQSPSALLGFEHCRCEP